MLHAVMEDKQHHVRQLAEAKIQTDLGEAAQKVCPTEFTQVDQEAA